MVTPRTIVALTAGVVLLVLVAGWQFGLSSRWSQRLSSGWVWETNYIGVNTSPDPATGEFPAEDTPGTYRRSMSVLARTGDSVLVRDSFETRDIKTGETTFEYETESEVDPATGEHVAAAFRGQYVVFPRNVRKQTYTLRTNYLEGIAMKYKGEAVIEGLGAYAFAYVGRGEYTKSYSGTADYPGVAVAAGQEIRCGDDRFFYRVWVEPLTGEVLKLEEGCPTGDYIYEVATGQKVAAVFRWTGATAGDQVLIRASEVRAERTRLLWSDRYAPALAAAAGLVLLAGAGTKIAIERARKASSRSAHR